MSGFLRRLLGYPRSVAVPFGFCSHFFVALSLALEFLDRNDSISNFYEASYSLHNGCLVLHVQPQCTRVVVTCLNPDGSCCFLFGSSGPGGPVVVAHCVDFHFHKDYSMSIKY